ncbi:TPA: DUF551 domain-containing protein [Klebsiella oxytoca]|nr:DUF551 domain-containing protein [Klebsiella oxytoca]
MTTITREQAQAVSDLKAGYTLGHADVAILKELARIALVSLEAEAVLYAAEETLAYAKHGELHLTCLSEPMGDAVIPLYATHPAPVVPDRSMFETWWESQNGSPFDSCDSLRTTDGYCDDGIDGQFEAWNACRAAMLRGANDSLTHEGKNHPEDKLGMVNHLGDANEKGNSPVIPDGWVACSERLPPEGYEPDGGAVCYLVWHKNEVDCGPQYSISNVFFLRKHWEKNFTHWMELPPAPEVK